MKVVTFVLYVCALSSFSQLTSASEEPAQKDILAQRGKGIVYQSTFDARADGIPENHRKEVLRDHNRLQDIINTLLLNAQLATDAREAGFDKEEIIKERMQLAADAELAKAWLQHYVDSQPEGNYEQLASEYYLVNKDKMLTPETINVSHILISNKKHTEEEAKSLADSLSSQLKDDPSKFDQFIMEYSDDPSVSSNKGKFEMVKKGDMVKPFEEAAFAMQEGEISAPVKSRFGYHIIRLDKRIEPATRSFDQVKSQLIERERKQHEDRIKREYLGSLTSLDVTLTEEALREMVRRQFGEEVLDSEAKDENSE